MELVVDHRTEGDFTVLDVHGEVDVYSAPALDGHITSTISAGQPRIVVNLTDVDFLDSTGLSALIRGLKHAREADGTLRVVASTEKIIKVFRITGLADPLGLAATVDEAVGA